jgi:hypothetical protein
MIKNTNNITTMGNKILNAADTVTPQPMGKSRDLGKIGHKTQKQEQANKNMQRVRSSCNL